MTKWGAKAAATVVALSLLHPAHWLPQKPEHKFIDGKIGNLSVRKQEVALDLCARYLRKFHNKELSSGDGLTYTWRREFFHNLPSFDPNHVTFGDLLDYIGQLENTRLDNGRFSKYTDAVVLKNVTQEDQELMEFEEAWHEVKAETYRLTFAHPQWSFRKRYMAALATVRPENYVHTAAHWRNFSFAQMPEQRQIENTTYSLDPRFAYAFSLFRPEEALKGVGAKEYWRMHEVFWNVNILNETSELPFAVRARIGDAAQTHNVPPDELAALASAWYDSTNSKTIITALNEQRTSQRDAQPFSVGVQLMTLGIMPHIRRMHENGVEGIITTDRGARPLGKITEHINAQLGLPQLPHTYFKFTGREKLVEAYARSLDGAVSAEEYDVLHANAALRELEKAHRQSGDPADQRTGIELKTELEKEVALAKPIYDKHAPLPESIQLERARAMLAKHTGKKVAVLDDWVNTGATRKNAANVLETLGITLAEMISIIDTPNHDGAAVYNDAGAFGDDSTWRESLFWYRLKGCTGLKYGVDDDSARIATFFTPHRDMPYTLPTPKEQFYSSEEMGWIARDVARTAFLDESTGPVRRRVFRETVQALRDYGVKESHEATEIRVNMIRTRGFYAALEHGVTKAIDKLRQDCGDESLRTYLSGGALGVAEQKVDATIKNVVAELRAI
jgi:hypothetical protein